MSAASLEQHLSAADANEVLAARLARSGDFGWAVTCLFYSALHLVEAYLLRHDVTNASHRHRQISMQRFPELHRIIDQYNHLKQQSENARYECVVIPRNTFISLRDLDYSSVASYVRSLVSV